MECLTKPGQSFSFFSILDKEVFLKKSYCSFRANESHSGWSLEVEKRERLGVCHHSRVHVSVWLRRVKNFRMCLFNKNFFLNEVDTEMPAALWLQLKYFSYNRI